MKEEVFEILSKDTGLSLMEVQQAMKQLLDNGFIVERNGYPIPALNGVGADESI